MGSAKKKHAKLAKAAELKEFKTALRRGERIDSVPEQELRERENHARRIADYDGIYLANVSIPCSLLSCFVLSLHFVLGLGWCMYE